MTTSDSLGTLIDPGMKPNSLSSQGSRTSMTTAFPLASNCFSSSQVTLLFDGSELNPLLSCNSVYKRNKIHTLAFRLSPVNRQNSVKRKTHYCVRDEQISDSTPSLVLQEQKLESGGYQTTVFSEPRVQISNTSILKPCVI